MKRREEFDKLIVEQGEIVAHVGDDKYKHIALIPAHQSFTFPNVDSCLALIMKLQDNSHVAAHIGLYTPDSVPIYDVYGQPTVYVQKELELIQGLIHNQDLVNMTVYRDHNDPNWQQFYTTLLEEPEIRILDQNHNIRDSDKPYAIDIQVSSDGLINAYDPKLIYFLTKKHELDVFKTNTLEKQHKATEIFKFAEQQITWLQTQIDKPETAPDTRARYLIQQQQAKELVEKAEQILNA